MRLQCRRPGFDPWVGKIPWRRERLPTPVFWPGELHGLYHPQSRKESDITGDFHSRLLPDFYSLHSYIHLHISASYSSCATKNHQISTAQHIPHVLESQGESKGQPWYHLPLCFICANSRACPSTSCSPSRHSPYCKRPPSSLSLPWT